MDAMPLVARLLASKELPRAAFAGARKLLIMGGRNLLTVIMRSLKSKNLYLQERTTGGGAPATAWFPS